MARRYARTLSTSAAALAMIAMAGCGSEGPAPPRAKCAIEGIDISRHQGDIDWPAVAGAGIKFAWIKATEGGDYRDPEFRRNWVLSRAAGIRRGAYHFVYWCRPAADQAAWFVANVPDDPNALPPVLDVEWNPGSRTCPQKVPREKALGEIRIMLDLMQRAYGRRPVIYAPADLYDEVLRGAFVDDPLWARGIATEPSAAGYDMRPWAIWQYSETGTVPGVEGAVDLDCFNGGTRAWEKWLRKE